MLLRARSESSDLDVKALGIALKHGTRLIMCSVIQYLDSRNFARIMKCELKMKLQHLHQLAILQREEQLISVTLFIRTVTALLTNIVLDSVRSLNIVLRFQILDHRLQGLEIAMCRNYLGAISKLFPHIT
ncbi:Hypothetical_protein [Hexamita inflata]|uniref:Hypothetical_protein n=1 Tax=Hexamita inflata TaxID=28002 RepID=A0AA86QWB3_9EUKA|nr:Hypothetical protein HINF_LOCUS53465 [Hexamita inflata]